MKYLNEEHLKEIGTNWLEIVKVIQDTVKQIRIGAFHQPLKPYLRFKNPINRIIAMPAYIGGEFDTAGIKWIASFPNNFNKNLLRAHSVTILNNSDTGVPYAIINTGLVSGIRTAAVSGFVVQKYITEYPDKSKKFNVGIIGFGPIGQLHYSLFTSLFSQSIEKIYVYDIRHVEELKLYDENSNIKIHLCDSWQEVFIAADIFITCTTAKTRYINLPPSKGCLYLNISLRDFTTEFMNAIDIFIVDDWDEVCRENTDIEVAHKECGLSKNDVIEIEKLASGWKFTNVGNQVTMFNPMGMAVFDIAVAKYFYEQAVETGIGIDLE